MGPKNAFWASSFDKSITSLPGSEAYDTANIIVRYPGCREAIIDVLWRANQRGVESISRKGLLDEVFQRHRKPTSTVDNTLGVMVGNRQFERPRRGHYGLAPALIQRLKVDCLVGSNSERSQSEREVSQVPDEVPMGKNGKNGTREPWFKKDDWGKSNGGWYSNGWWFYQL